MDPLLQYLIVCPLVFIAGFIDSIAGGGGFISLPAYMIAGLPPHAAIGTNKFSSCLGSIVATWRYFRRGYFSIPTALPSVAAALAGAWAGARLTLMVPSGIFMKVMLVILPLSALFVFRIKHFDSSKPAFSRKKTTALAAVIAALIGAYDGFYGPGTGTFLMLLLVYVARMTLNNAAGMTKAINVSSNLAALIIFMRGGVVLFPLALVAAIFGIAGNYIGSGFFIKAGKGIAKPMTLIVLIIFFVKILYEYLSA